MTARDELESAVARAYRLILGRPADPVGAEGYLRALRAGEVTLADVCASLAASEEFTARLFPAEPTPEPSDDPDLIDAAELIRTTSVEELAARAETYFHALDDPDTLLAKPFKDAAETPDLLVTFGQALRALRPLPGMTVLDFGAGTGWTSRSLTQLGCHVIALDVSPSALDLGKRLFDVLPVIGDQSAPEFLVFDGRRFDLPDASVDRILSYDALHHVPNPAEVIGEMARVLRPGGIAAFAEPGDRHSVQLGAQYEMRNFGVLENDVVIEDIWEWARQAGFAELRLCLLDSSPRWVDLDTFRDVVAGRDDEAFTGHVRRAFNDRRMFWLRRDGAEVPDSREADGLVGEVTMENVDVDHSGPATVVTGRCHVHNPGPRRWLPSDAEYGPVRLGVRLHLRDHTVRDFARIPLPGRGIDPGESATVDVHVELPPQPEPAHAVEFDLVSEYVCWFRLGGSRTVTVPLVRAAGR